MQKKEKRKGKTTKNLSEHNDLNVIVFNDVEHNVIEGGDSIMLWASWGMKLMTQRI